MKMVLWISSMHISVHIKSASKMFFFFSILEHWTSQLPINTCYVNIRSQCSEINKKKKDYHYCVRLQYSLLLNVSCQ